MSGIDGSVGDFGDGPFPSELDRLNWGAVFFPWFWALVHGVWPWFVGLGAFSLAGRFFFSVYYSWPIGQTFAGRLVVPMIFVAADVALAVVFGLRANRLVWERENRMIILGTRTVDKRGTLSRYVRSQRTWARAGFALFLFGALVGLLPSATIPPDRMFAAWIVFGFQVLVLGAVWAWARSRRPRTLETAAEPT